MEPTLANSSPEKGHCHTAHGGDVGPVHALSVVFSCFTLVHFGSTVAKICVPRGSTRAYKGAWCGHPGAARPHLSSLQSEEEEEGRKEGRRKEGRKEGLTMPALKYFLSQLILSWLLLFKKGIMQANGLKKKQKQMK